MRLAEHSVPKKNPMGREIGTEGGLSFCSLQEAVADFSGRVTGKILFVSDTRSCFSLAFAARMPRAVSAVLDGEDALPLFGMPETEAVFAAGGRNVLVAARVFAGITKKPCAVLPFDSDCRGTGEGTEEALIAGGRMEFSLAKAAVYADEALAAPTLAEGYARLLLCRLSLFEQFALSRFGDALPPSEALYGILSDIGKVTDGREILLKSAAVSSVREAERGEGHLLAAKVGNFAAFEALSTLYTAFFRSGRPRKYVVPDYLRRAAEAGIPQAEIVVPTEEAYAHRALVLEGKRAEFLRELHFFMQYREHFRRTYRALGGKCEKAPREAVKYLPEHSRGLTAIIRDFGLMEEL